MKYSTINNKMEELQNNNTPDDSLVIERYSADDLLANIKNGTLNDDNWTEVFKYMANNQDRKEHMSLYNEYVMNDFSLLALCFSSEIKINLTPAERQMGVELFRRTFEDHVIHSWIADDTSDFYRAYKECLELPETHQHYITENTHHHLRDKCVTLHYILGSSVEEYEKENSAFYVMIKMLRLTAETVPVYMMVKKVEPDNQFKNIYYELIVSIPKNNSLSKQLMEFSNSKKKIETSFLDLTFETSCKETIADCRIKFDGFVNAVIMGDRVLTDEEFFAQLAMIEEKRDGVMDDLDLMIKRKHT